MKKLMLAMVVVAMMAGNSQAWLISESFWNSGYVVTASDPLNDHASGGANPEYDLLKLWYKADFDAGMAYFRLDMASAPIGGGELFQVAIDTLNGGSFVNGEAESIILEQFEDISVDRFLSINVPNPPAVPVNGQYIVDTGDDTAGSYDPKTMADVGGAFAYTEADVDGVSPGTEGVFEWSLALANINQDKWINVYAGSGTTWPGPGYIDDTLNGGAMKVSTIPEPCTMAMGGVLAAMAGLRAMRQRKQNAVQA